MDDLISRQAAIDAIRASTSKYTGFMEMEMYTDDDAVEAINGVPSIDAVPVIRCKDCKHLLPNDRIAPNWWRICDYWRTGVDENEYCARGERKEQ